MHASSRSGTRVHAIRARSNHYLLSSVPYNWSIIFRRLWYFPKELAQTGLVWSHSNRGHFIPACRYNLCASDIRTNWTRLRGRGKVRARKYRSFLFLYLFPSPHRSFESRVRLSLTFTRACVYNMRALRFLLVYLKFPIVRRLKLLWLTLTQLNSSCEIEFLPVYKPSEAEKLDPKLYANNVRRLMAEWVDGFFFLSLSLFFRAQEINEKIII